MDMPSPMRIAAVGSDVCGGGDGAEGAVAKSSRSLPEEAMTLH